METTNLHKASSSATQFHTFVKPFVSVTVITAIILLMGISLQFPLFRYRPHNDNMDTVSAVSPSPYNYNNDSMDTVSAVSRSPYNYNNDSMNTDSEAVFIQTCHRGDLVRVDNFSLSNRSSLMAPSSGKVTCPRNLSLANLPLPLTALLTFPGSGNTWTRHLLQQLTGIATGSTYFDRSLRRNGFPFEGKVRDVIAVKTHNLAYKNEMALSEFKRMIHVIRNIYDSILADRRRYITRGDHTANVRVNQSSHEWTVALVTYLKKWDKFMRDAFAFNGPTLVVFYEDLKSHLPSQLKRMADFLACDHLKEFSFCCALKESEGAFHRKPNAQTVETVFNKRHRRLVNKHIQDIAEFLKKTHPDVSARILSYRMPV